MARPAGGRSRKNRRDDAPTSVRPLPERADVLVVGGGASGLAAAIAAGRAGARVVVAEASRAAGRPILASGNGRCNLAHAALGASWEPDAAWPVLAGPGGFVDARGEGRAAGPAFDLYSDRALARAVMGADPLRDVLGFFDGLGLWCVRDEQGRYFPHARHAQSVLAVMLAELDALGVAVCCESRATGLAAAEGGAWDVAFEGGRHVRAGRVVWAAGGGSAREVAADLGLAYVAERPVLCPLACDEEGVRGLDGVRASCVLTLRRPGAGVVASERGEVLFRPYGVSGIAAFDLSRHALPGDVLELDFVSDALMASVGDGAWAINLDLMLKERLSERVNQAHNGASRLRILDGVLHPALARHIMEHVCGPDGSRGVDLSLLATMLLRFSITVEGLADELHAQVTRGGVANEEVRPETLGLRARPGVFLCGEALDMDAACGGFNLAWAWLSGLRAGAAAARG